MTISKRSLIYSLIIYTVAINGQELKKHLDVKASHETVHTLTFLNAEEFERFTQNSSLDYPELRNVTANGCHLSGFSLTVSFYAVRYLDLSNNQIGSLDSTSFNKVPNVETLVLSHNVLAIIADDTFSKLKQLKILLLDHNELTIFDFKWVNSNTKLHTLHLQQNRIAEILGIASGAPQMPVKVLNLGGNQLINISALQLSCKHIETLRLSNNTNLNFDASESLSAFNDSLKALFIDGVNHQRDMTGQLARFNKLSKLGVGQVDAIRSHRILNRLIVRGFKIQFYGYKHLNHDNFPRLTTLTISYSDKTVDCKSLSTLAKHLHAQGIDFLVRNQQIIAEQAIAEQLDCFSHLIRQWATWTAVAILSLIVIIIVIVLCRYHLKKVYQRNLVKILAKSEFQRYRSVRYSVDINQIFASTESQVDADDDGY